MHKKLIKSTKIWPPQNKQTYLTVQIVNHNTIKQPKYLITDQRLLAVNTGITSSYALIGICYKDHIATNTILF